MSEKIVMVLRNTGKVISSQLSVKQVLSFQSSVVSKGPWFSCILVRLARTSGAELRLAGYRKNEVCLLGVFGDGCRTDARSAA